MAIFEKTIRNKNFDKLLRKLENEIPDSSWSADLEAGSDFKEGDARCSVRVFERYSMMGGNRLSLTLTMFQNADSPIRLSAITAGGSQAVFFKVNTLGEESFLNDVKDLLEEILELSLIHISEPTSVQHSVSHPVPCGFGHDPVCHHRKYQHME